MTEREQTNHAIHVDQLGRLKRIAGQVTGIVKMIEEERYCMDILIQLKAVRAALKKVEGNILRCHMEHCVAKFMGESEDAQAKTNEIMAYFDAEKD